MTKFGLVRTILWPEIFFGLKFFSSLNFWTHNFWQQLRHFFLYHVLIHKPKCTWEWSLTLALAQLVGFKIFVDPKYYESKNWIKQKVGPIWTKFLWTHIFLDPIFLGFTDHKHFGPKIFSYKNVLGLKVFLKISFFIFIFSKSVNHNILCPKFFKTQLFWEAKGFDSKNS